ncbi:hypothetical protein [Inhella crocodyli]|uniref:Uncharacterized protein n=1 Tax=Inhella crocodyli TaxID=2499851 RepID=A0A437LLL6_9BURK|nr:hypothetical protein [Inhella crocodyli]RVT86244.1 hypothetical protein EOD73_09435 [Inhella crocodyli]
MDITTIATLLGNVKTATEIAKAIKDSGATLEGAEAKFRLAELISALADVKIEAATVQEQLLSAQLRIRELEDAATTHAVMRWQQPCYWKPAGEGHPDLPYCQPCYDEHRRLSLLNDWGEGQFRCMVCGKTFETPERIERRRQQNAAQIATRSRTI